MLCLAFVTSKEDPHDVDVFLLMEDSFDVQSVSGEARILFDHGPAQSYFGCSIFWLRRLAVINAEESALADWQIRRDGRRRGIIEVVRRRDDR